MRFEKNDQVYAPHIGTQVYTLKECNQGSPEPQTYPLVIKTYSTPTGGNMSSLKDKPTTWIAGPDITEVTCDGRLYQDGLPVIWIATGANRAELEELHGIRFDPAPNTIMFTLNGQNLIMTEGSSIKQAIEKIERLHKH